MSEPKKRKYATRRTRLKQPTEKKDPCEKEKEKRRRKRQAKEREKAREGTGSSGAPALPLRQGIPPYMRPASGSFEDLGYDALEKQMNMEDIQESVKFTMRRAQDFRKSKHRFERERDAEIIEAQAKREVDNMLAVEQNSRDVKTTTEAKADDVVRGVTTGLVPRRMYGRGANGLGAEYKDASGRGTGVYAEAKYDPIDRQFRMWPDQRAAARNGRLQAEIDAPFPDRQVRIPLGVAPPRRSLFNSFDEQGRDHYVYREMPYG